MLYEQLLATRTQQPADAIVNANRLMNEYAGTPYAGMAGLTLARIQHDRGDRAAARSALQWTLANAKGPALHAARLRLARLQLEAGEVEAARALLGVKDRGGFDAEYQELQGDLLRSQGQPNDARAAYREAIRRTPADAAYLRLLTMKLDDLGPEESR